MSLLEAILLGALQGVTEFLPISSSGHLALAQHFFGIEEADLAFDVVLHVATLCAVVLVYFDSLRSIASSLWTSVTRATTGSDAETSSARTTRRTRDLRLLAALVVASIPTAIIGLLLREPMETVWHRPAFVASMLITTGLILWLPSLRQSSDRAQREQNGHGKAIGMASALVVGAVQGLAVTPGISRAGSTISVARLLGIGRESAARFSFLMSIPAILGALVLQLPDLQPSSASVLPLVVGFATAFGVGWISLRALLAVLRGGRFALFSIYCFALGAIVLAIELGG